jgi:menaquinone-dependent protoporphyrinogen oxidase
MKAGMKRGRQTPVDKTRREILRHAGMAFFVGLSGGTFIPIAVAEEDHRIRFIEKTIAASAPTAGKARVLVAYASMYGSTSGIALAIGEELARLGHAVDVRKAVHVSDMGAYHGVIVGSAIKGSEWLPDARDLLATNCDYLATVPVAYFHASMTMATPNNDKTRIRSDSWFEPLLADFPAIVPKAKGSFAGALDFKKMSPTHRLFYPLMAGNSREGDFRDFARIRQWAVATERAMYG